MCQDSQHFWLTGARYLEEKRAIALEFSHLTIKRTVRLPFFPSFFVSKGILNLGSLQRVLSCSGKRFVVKGIGSRFKVTASTFSDLNRLADLLFRETGFRALVLRPERQFLLQKNLSYFDCVSFFSGNGFAKHAQSSFPMACVSFFSEPLNETLPLLLEEEPAIAEKAIESIALSNLLRLPVAGLPGGDFTQLEALFENLFWKTGLGIKAASLSHASAIRNKAPLPKMPGLAEVDFAFLWPVLLTRPLYNLGPDSLDCGCCRPNGFLDKNVLPNSLVEVEFLQDGFFFESISGDFACFFHKRFPGRESRERRMREFCLNSIPLGPFFRGQKAIVLLGDALRLQAAKQVGITSVKKPHWFCLGRESLVSRQVACFNKAVSSIEAEMDEMHSFALKQHGVLGSAVLSKNLEYRLLQARLEANSRLLHMVPKHLCDGRSAFFRKRVCSAIEAIEATLLNNFGEFAEAMKNRVVAFSESKAYVSTARPYALIKQFALNRQVPALIRAKNR